MKRNARKKNVNVHIDFYNVRIPIFVKRVYTVIHCVDPYNPICYAKKSSLVFLAHLKNIENHLNCH